MALSNPLIELNHIQYQLADGSAIADDLSFALHEHERVAITGANGSGKSTLFAIMMGLKKVKAGEVRLFNQRCAKEADFAAFRTQIGLVFQDPNDQLFCPTVIEDVCFGPLNQGVSQAQALVIARNTLRQLNISHLENAISYQLSGGQKRIVALATVLAMQPKVLILDEPTNDLDQHHTQVLIDTLSQLSLPMVLVCHDSHIRSQLVSKEYQLDKGKLTLKQAK
ncbi:energy-coupling factor ABC transporter ATP-binding protein [Shewanella intestini]|uniref:Energy-coupling factor ABC transporter ATP-binding protein n=1 Tax=Shewanella intestini TaxID=2017544 RepID=A0ABS5HZL7_9GAMM|nr:MULTISPECIES: energy-coupling factor ABC transporter ATP-binding protein [Shewanella]MBR9726869.1 energy-coupling factor ABC transporter ATP-binding protein [Shewanella intestini]MRG34565.1 ATP-binding cassette domain-containing protein [Shewanella sp. XMDDZSB0408]